MAFQARSMNDCWEWDGWNVKGYGRLTVNGKSELAHRMMYRLAVGPIPDDQHVLHRCDNPRCVNPSHLFLGSHTDNMQDMVAKGRHRAPRGSGHGGAKLTDDDVRSIRLDYASGVSQRTLSQRHGIGQPTISKIVLRKTWRHVDT